MLAGGIGPLERVADGFTTGGRVARQPVGPGQQQEAVREVEGLALDPGAFHRAFDPLDRVRETVAGAQPAAERLADDHQVAHGEPLPQPVRLVEHPGEVVEIAGFRGHDRGVGDGVPPRRQMIGVGGRVESGSSELGGHVGVPLPQLDEGEPDATDHQRVLCVERQVLVAVGQVVALDRLLEMAAGVTKVTAPERAHAQQIAALGAGDRVVALVVEERPSELAALVEAASLQPGQAEPAENRGIDRPVEPPAQ